MEFYEQNKRTVNAAIIGIVLLLLVIWTVPAFKPDPDHPVVNATTHQVEPGKMLSNEFLIMIFVAAMAPIVYLLTNKEEETFSRRRSLINVWKDIPEYELVKYGIQHIRHQIFNHETYLVPTNDSNLFVTRIPMYEEGKNYYMALDMMEDWKTRNKDTPLFSFWKANISLEHAKTALVRSTSLKYAKLVQDAKTIGISPEAIKRQIAQQEIAESEKKRRELEGEFYD